VVNKTTFRKKDDKIVKFGDIFYANLQEDGHIQGGFRPVIIAQNDIGNRFSPTIWIIPLTSRTEKGKHLPTHVFIESDISGLPRDSVALVEQMRVVNKDVLAGDKVSSLSIDAWGKIKNALQIQCPFFAS
jgi:mRNA interferase MazF